VTLDDALAELWEWGRWARRSVVPAQAMESPLSRLMKRSADDYDGPVEPLAMMVDERAAMRTDRVLMRLPRCHLVVIKRHYVGLEAVDWRERHPAIRAYMDAREESPS